MGRKRFGLLATTLVALNLFLWLAPPGLALRQSIVDQLFGPRLVRAEVIDSTGGSTTSDIHVDRGVVTEQSATDITLSELDGRVQVIQLSPSTQLRRRTLLGWRVLVIWPANGAAVSVVPEVRPQGSGGSGH